MSSVLNQSMPAARAYAARTPMAFAAVLLAAAALGSGCANMKRDHVVVGSVPDDYRTNHPIVIAEQEQVLDLPAGANGGALTKGEKHTIDGFLSRFEAGSGGIVRVLVPAGSANEAAAHRKATAISAAMQDIGVPRHAIVIEAYGVMSPEAEAPVRIAYSALRAGTEACGRWPADLNMNPENKHYANFGCSYQKNLAAQIANPSDLLGPRRSTEIDPERRGIAIDDYKKTQTPWTPTLVY